MAPLLDRPPYLPIVEPRTPVGVVHDEGSRRTTELMVHVQRGAEGRPVVPGGMLYVHRFERRSLTNLAVHHAVHRAAARQAQMSLTGAALQRGEHVGRRFLEDDLRRRCDRFVTWFD